MEIKVDFRIEGPYLHEESNQNYWVWMVWIPGTDLAQTSSRWTLAECYVDMDSWAFFWTSKRLKDHCECGSRKLYAPFAPGHANWCPVTPLKIQPAKPRPSKP